MADQTGRVLIVDPDPSGARSLSELIESLGHQVVTASSGEEGLRRFWDVLPDLIVVDVQPLGANAERMSRELQRTDYGVITPIVVHSPRHATLSRFEAMRAYGAVDYVIKPLQESKIRALLDWVLAGRYERSQPLPQPVLDRFDLSSDSEGVVSLESGSLPYLLGRAEEEKLSGLLLMIAGAYKTILLLEQGLIIGTCSNAAAEQIDRVLLSMRKLTPAQLSEVKARAHNGQDLLPLLGFLGILRSDERRDVLRYQALTSGVSMFRQGSGLLQFRHGESVECTLLDAGIRPTTLALIGLRKNPALLRTATERFVRDPVVFSATSPGIRFSSRALPLTKFERTVLSLVNGERSVKELRELGRLAQIDLDEPLAVLVGSGILKPIAVQPPARAAPRSEPLSDPVSCVPASGTLDQWSFARLVGALLREGATGMLTIEGPAVRSFAFVNREVVFASSNRPEDCLGRLLVADRIIRREALERALALQRGVPERRLGSLLVEMHELTPDSLYRALRSQILHILEDTFSWAHGQFRFVASARPPEWTVRLDVEPVSLLRNGASRMTHDQLRGRWSRGNAHLVAGDRDPDAKVLTGPELEHLSEASRVGGIALAGVDVGILRRALLLVEAGFARVVGELDPEPGEAMTAPRTEAAPQLPPEPAAPVDPPAAPDEEEPSPRPHAIDLKLDVSAEPVPQPDKPADPGGRIMDFLRDEFLADKRASEERLRSTEETLRKVIEELGRLRERTCQLERENRALRRQSRTRAAPRAKRAEPIDAAATPAAGDAGTGASNHEVPAAPEAAPPATKRTRAARGTKVAAGKRRTRRTPGKEPRAAGADEAAAQAPEVPGPGGLDETEVDLPAASALQGGEREETAPETAPRQPSTSPAWPRHG